MGKPYPSELEALGNTYTWSLSAPVQNLASWVRSVARLPLMAVGSGGSFTSAIYANFVHGLFTGRVAKAVTPLEATVSPVHLPNLAVLLLSAGGGNPDIVACANRARRSPPSRFGVFCTRKGSPLAEAVAGSENVSLHEYELPSGKDGFLATNSLLATAVLLTRAYAEAWSATPALPPTLADLVHPESDPRAFWNEVRARCQPLWERETIVVLHGHASQAAAVDLESKFTEAAIGHLQTADYRHFAHGRHYWMARYRESSAVLALVTPEDRALADRTLKLLPDGIPVAMLDLAQDSLLGALAGLVIGMNVVGMAANARGGDPGRPSVPTFGRRLYHLGGLHAPPPPESVLTVDDAVAIERKAGMGVVNLAAQGELGMWRAALATFRQSLQSASFTAVVFDYDGTLCGPADRFTGPGPEVAERLADLLRAGILVGIATGRGKSVRKDLRKIFPEQVLWDRVLVGYHNGGEIGWLTEDTQPPETAELDVSLQTLSEAMQAEPRLTRAVKIEAKLRQITLELPPGADCDEVWDLAESLVRRQATGGVTLVRSSHSIDALAPGVSKRLLVDHLRQELAEGGQAGGILCVGDKGRWPGNDFALLEETLSLSVDEASSDPNTCWNLAPPGERCVSAALTYLRALRVDAGRFSIGL